MPSIESYFELVENCIGNLGIDPESCEGEKKGQWNLKKGSANVWIDVWYIEKEHRSYLQVMAPIIHIPTSGNLLDLYEDLLKINDRLYGAAFTVYKKWIWLKTIRETDNLDESEAMAMITRVGNYADEYDDYLKVRYEQDDRKSPSSSTPGALSA